MELTDDEQRLKEQMWVDAQKWGYTGLFGWFQNLGHKCIDKISRKKARKGRSLLSLEIGCGSGRHFRFAENGNYMGIELRYSLLKEAHAHFPEHPVIQGDIYSLPFCGSSFDRIISIYVFEHLHNLPVCLAEVQRVLKKNGELLVALPAEGGIALDLGRRLTSKRYFEKKYNVDYLRIVQAEHCNTCKEVIEEISNWFNIGKIIYLPFHIPIIHLNSIIVMHCINDKNGKNGL